MAATRLWWLTRETVRNRARFSVDALVIAVSVIVFTHLWMALVGVAAVHALAGLRTAWVRADHGTGRSRHASNAQFAAIVVPMVVAGTVALSAVR